MYQRAQLKQSVRQQLRQTRPRPMWVALLYMFVVSVGESILQGITNGVSGLSFLLEEISELASYGYDPEQIIGDIVLRYANHLGTLIASLVAVSLLSSVLITLWQGLMNVGFRGYCLTLVKGEKAAPVQIFSGFGMFGRVVLTGLLLWVFTSLWTALWTVCLVVVAVIGALLPEGVGLVLIFLGAIGYCVMVVRVVLRYAMTYYVLLDTGKYGLEAISESKRMMKGKKGKLFVLELSFIGWYLIEAAILLLGTALIGVIAAAGFPVSGGGLGILGGMVAGIFAVFGMMMAAIWLFSMWLQPYVTGSVAKFYLTFREQAPAPEQWPSLGGTSSHGGGDQTTEY